MELKTQKETFIGFTLGPILETMGMTSTPAGLWAASYMFSFLTRSICEYLVKNKNVSEEDIFSPYFSLSEKPTMDGVGLYHDHIIVRKGDLTLIDAAEAADAAKRKLKSLLLPDQKESKELGEVFREDEFDELVDDYIKISIFEFEKDSGETAIMASKDHFNCIELESSIMPAIERNPLLSLFDGRESGVNSVAKNRLIKSSGLVKQETSEEWQLYGGDRKNIRSIENIAHGNGPEDKKTTYYYVVLRSDGDSMSDVIKQCDENAESGNQIIKFSRACLEYCKEAAECVKKYGGVTIYSGGDDLLAIVPVESDLKLNVENVDRQKDVFDLITDISAIFKQRFEKLKEDLGAEDMPVPTISFGAAVCYERFPLYEALSLSADMLFEIAKNQKDAENKSEKDFTAITFRKHSGQTETLLIKNSSLSKVTKLFDDIYKGGERIKDFLSSINNKLFTFQELFRTALGLGKDTVKNAFKNTFDSEIHNDNEFIFGECADLLWGIENDEPEYRIHALFPDDGEYKRDKDNDVVQSFDKLFRVIKFFGEKTDRRDDR